MTGPWKRAAGAYKMKSKLQWTQGADANEQEEKWGDVPHVLSQRRRGHDEDAAAVGNIFDFLEHEEW